MKPRRRAHGNLTAVTQFDDGGLPVTQSPVERGAGLAVRVKLSGDYERPVEIVECTALEYSLLFGGARQRRTATLSPVGSTAAAKRSSPGQCPDSSNSISEGGVCQGKRSWPYDAPTRRSARRVFRNPPLQSGDSRRSANRADYEAYRRKGASFARQRGFFGNRSALQRVNMQQCTRSSPLCIARAPPLFSACSSC